MGALLEVIVTSVADSVEAEAGGADRLELIAAPELAGLTPSLEVVEAVLGAVHIPVRVMLRDAPAMSLASSAELAQLQATAARFAQLPINGIVAGFIKDGAVDVAVMSALYDAAPELRVTFHRAFDVLTEQARAIEALKQLSQVDRILTCGEGATLADRLASVARWQACAAPNITILLAAGRDANRLDGASLPDPRLEVHVGRAARIPQTASAPVSRERVAALKTALNSGVSLNQ